MMMIVGNDVSGAELVAERSLSRIVLQTTMPTKKNGERKGQKELQREERE